MRSLSLLLCLIFALALFLMKILGVIHITWLVVLSPIIIPVALAWFLSAARDLVNIIKF